jgi:hypothetical protein
MLLPFSLRYGMLCISLSDEVDAGYRFGQLGLKLLEVYKMEEYLPRVYCAVYGKFILKLPLCSPVLLPESHSSFLLLIKLRAY